MKICFLMYQGNMYSGGQGVYLYYLTRELARMGHDVHVIAGPHQGHRATVVQLAEPTGSRHTVQCEDGQTVRLSKVHVQRAVPTR